jgi:YD repeat-containing protein
MIKKKTSLLSLIFMAVLGGCAVLDNKPVLVEVQLTPWQTSTADIPLATIAPEVAVPIHTPLPTPTPTIHIVTLGETISSIALRYGLDINTVLAANPEIDPYTLKVGAQVKIPLGNSKLLIGEISEPMALSLGESECSLTPDAGLWCQVMVSNPLGDAASNIAVAFSIVNNSSGEAINQTAPTILNKLDPGDSLPAVVFFAAPIPADFAVTSSLASAFPAAQSGKTFYSVNSENPAIEIIGRQAKVSGEAFIAADPGKTVDVWVAALAYDTQGNLVGVRRTESRVTLIKEKGLVFNLNVYSTGNPIESVVIKGEAMLVK